MRTQDPSFETKLEVKQEVTGEINENDSILTEYIQALNLATTENRLGSQERADSVFCVYSDILELIHEEEISMDSAPIVSFVDGLIYEVIGSYYHFTLSLGESSQELYFQGIKAIENGELAQHLKFKIVNLEAILERTKNIFLSAYQIDPRKFRQSSNCLRLKACQQITSQQLVDAHLLNFIIANNLRLKTDPFVEAIKLINTLTSPEQTKIKSKQVKLKFKELKTLLDLNYYTLYKILVKTPSRDANIITMMELLVILYDASINLMLEIPGFARSEVLAQSERQYLLQKLLKEQGALKSCSLVSYVNKEKLIHPTNDVSFSLLKHRSPADLAKHMNLVKTRIADLRKNQVHAPTTKILTTPGLRRVTADKVALEITLAESKRAELEAKSASTQLDRNKKTKEKVSTITKEPTPRPVAEIPRAAIPPVKTNTVAQLIQRRQYDKAILFIKRKNLSLDKTNINDFKKYLLGLFDLANCYQSQAKYQINWQGHYCQINIAFTCYDKLVRLIDTIRKEFATYKENYLEKDREAKSICNYYALSLRDARNSLLELEKNWKSLQEKYRKEKTARDTILKAIKIKRDAAEQDGPKSGAHHISKKSQDFYRLRDKHELYRDCTVPLLKIIKDIDHSIYQSQHQYTAFSIVLTGRIKEILMALNPETSTQSFIHGGFVRDSLTKDIPNDVDIITTLNAKAVLNILFNMRILNARAVSETLITCDANVGGRRLHFDIGLVDSVSPLSLKKIAQQRDFHGNDLFLGVDGRVIDPSRLGVPATQNKALTLVGKSPKKSFLADPIRMFKAITLVVLKGYELSQDIRSLIKNNIQSLEKPGVIPHALSKARQLVYYPKTSTMTAVQIKELLDDIKFPDYLRPHIIAHGIRLELKSSVKSTMRRWTPGTFKAEASRPVSTETTSSPQSPSL